MKKFGTLTRSLVALRTPHSTLLPYGYSTRVLYSYSSATVIYHTVTYHNNSLMSSGGGADTLVPRVLSLSICRTYRARVPYVYTGYTDRVMYDDVLRQNCCTAVL